MKNLIYVCLLIVIESTATFAQPPTIHWQKYLGGTSGDLAYSIQQTVDGGYIVAGRTGSTDGDVSGNHGNFDYWVVKLSSLGIMQWQKCLGGSGFDYAISIQQTADSGYIVTGYSTSNDGDVSGNHGSYDYWVVRLNAIGGIQWQQSLGGGGSDVAYSIHQTADLGYIVAGVSKSNDGDVSGNQGGNDYWVVKLDSTGVIQWQKSLGGTGDDGQIWSSGSISEPRLSIQQTADSGYIVAGPSNSNDGDVSGNHGNYDYWIVKLTATGVIQWQQSLGGTGNDAANSIRQTADSGYIVTGYSTSNDGDVSGNHGSEDYWVVKLNATGVIQWQKSLGGAGSDVAYSIQQTADSGYIVAGMSKSNNGDVSGNHGSYDYWVVRLNAIGGIQWQQSLGGGGSDVAHSIQQTADEGYIVAGSSSSGGTNYWVVKLHDCNLFMPSITPVGATTFCNGGSIQLNILPGMAYQWQNNGVDIAGATNNSYSANFSGSYGAIVSDSFNCSFSPSPIIVTDISPTIFINVPLSQVICPQSITLNASGTASTYVWNNGVTNGVPFTPYTSSSYTVTGTDSNGCSSVLSCYVGLHPVPISQQIIGNPSIIPFQPYTYIVNNTTGYSYTWIPQNGAVQTGQGTNSVNVIWAGSGPYSITLIQTNANGCSDTTSLMVINSSCNLPININPIIPAQLCIGDTVLLIAQVSSLPATYQWIKNGQILNSQTNDTLLVTSTGNYQVQVTSSGCTNISNNTPVSFLPAPSVPVITSLGNTGSCVAPSIVLKANGGPYQIYLWNTGITADTMIATSSGNYNVTVTGSNGCQAKSTDFPVNISALPVFPICLVTVDSSTGYNNVVWEKPTIVGVDSFFIYREGSQLNVYDKIGAKEKNEFSMFTDSNSNVNQQSYKYKVAVLDTCGNITLMSDYHKTIHLTVNQGLGNVWNLIWSAYEGFTYSSYNIYRGNNTGSLQLLTTISSANNSYTDVNPPANVNYYLVEVISPNGCFPTAKTASQNSTISNFVSIISTNVNETSWNKKPIYVYPNPSNGVYNIVCNAELNAEITDVTGRKITKIKNVKNIDISNQACGVYFLKLSDENGGLQKIIELIKK